MTQILIYTYSTNTNYGIPVPSGYRHESINPSGTVHQVFTDETLPMSFENGDIKRKTFRIKQQNNN